jgi:hypothetical protein
MNGFGSLGGGSLKVDATKVGGLLPYDAAKQYSNVGPDYVEHLGKIWKYVNAAPSTGNAPAAVSAFWTEISAGEFVHQRNTDTALKRTNGNTVLADDLLTAATKAEVEARALTTGAPEPAEAALKAVTPKGMYWWWEKLCTLPLSFTDTITFAKAFIITAFAGVGERILIVDNTGRIVNAYITADEFVAVPPTLTSTGIPGQKAYAAPYLYYCIATNVWVKFLAEGSEYGIQELYVAIPPTLTSTGLKGQRAYDSTNSRMYECIQDNVWIYWPINKV